jgi:hypothetical protein
VAGGYMALCFVVQVEASKVSTSEKKRLTDGRVFSPFFQNQRLISAH